MEEPKLTKGGQEKHEELLRSEGAAPNQRVTLFAFNALPAGAQNITAVNTPTGTADAVNPGGVPSVIVAVN